MRDFQTIWVETRSNYLAIRLNRPDKHNALNPTMIAELTEIFAWAARLDGVRAVVLSGEGKSFCAGADLHYMREIAGFGEEENIADGQKLATLFDTIFTCQLPVIAVVQGMCMGGANGLIATTDIVIADTDSSFAFSEVRLGIIPATIAPYVIRRCGEAAARELMLTGRRFSADEAMRFGLVNRVARADEREKTIATYLNYFNEAAPSAIAECKKLIRFLAGSNLATTGLIPETARIIARARASEEGQEGIKAFFEKRNPFWIQD